MRTEFKEWMIAEHYRVAQLYRQMLHKEYQKTKDFFGEITLIAYSLPNFLIRYFALSLTVLLSMFKILKTPALLPINY